MIEALLQAERLLLHGMVDDAERIYAAAVDQDPLNAIAMVGLARVALERGDDLLAYTHARRALDVDPENAAALRLEARLAEVFAARGTPAGPVAPLAADPEMTPDVATARPGGAEARPSERAIFTRNPSMAEHQQMEQALDVPRASPIDARGTPAAPDGSEQPPARRPGLFRRLLGD
jgi:tetratricopeptide (TPR) repeat protein